MVSDVRRLQIDDHLVDSIETSISEKDSLSKCGSTASWSGDDELLGDECAVASVDSDQPAPFFRLVVLHFTQLDFFVIWARANEGLSNVGK